MLQIHFETSSFKLLLGHQGQLGDGGQIGRAHHDNRRSVVARLFEQLFGFGSIAHTREACGVFIGEHGAAWVDAATRPDQLGHAHLGVDEGLLAHRQHGGLAHFQVVERRVQVVETHHILKTCGGEIVHLHTSAFLQGVVLFKAGLLHHVHFTGQDGIELGLRVADDDPFHTVEVDGPPTSQAAGRFGARHVLGVALVHRDGAGLEFIGLEDEGS